MFVYEESWAKNHCESPGLTWEELLEQVGLGTPEPYAQAKAFFQDALAPSNAPVDFFSTLSQLRESPVRDEVDLEFCFSHLPKTEKNTFLKKLALLYLKSPLATTDRLARTGQLPECPVLRQHRVLSAPELKLVRARQSSPVFQELYQTLADLRGDKTTRLIETWEMTESLTERPKAALFLRHASPSVLLDRLVEKAAAENRIGRTARIFFEGTAASRAYLISVAATLGLRLSEPESTGSLPLKHEGFERIRRSGLPLPERLRLSRLFLQTKGSPDFREWLDHQKVASDYQELLLNDPERSPPQPKDSIPLLPFHPLPPRSRTIDLFFLEPLPETQGTLAFDPSERFRLFAQGFLLQDSDPLKGRNAERLNSLLNVLGKRPRVFLTLDFSCKTPGKLLRAKTASQMAQAPKLTPLPPPLILSATALETFADCPSKYFYSQALRLRKPLPDEQAFAIIFGKLVHRTLEWAFQENPWDVVDETVLLRIFERALLEAEAPSAAWFRVSLKQRFMPVAARVAQMERKLREALGPLTPIRFEQSFEFELSGATFRGRIDRIDRSDSGALFVLDYKTGSVDFSPEHIKKGHHFQSLIYVLSQTEPIGGVLFYDLKAGEVRRGVLRDREGIKKFFTRGHALSEEGWENLIGVGKEHIDSLISRINAGDFTATPSAAACDRCDMGLFCHRQSGVSG